MHGHGLEIKRLFAGGGGAKSRFWIQIHADVLGMPVLLPREPEACASVRRWSRRSTPAGSRIWTEAAREMVRIAEVVEPRPETRAAYDEGYARYRATYPALRELMHEV